MTKIFMKHRRFDRWQLLVLLGFILSACGADWPQFLGPDRNGKSTETGSFVEWTDRGPPLVWHRKLGSGYGIGSVYAGKFYQFDRHGDRARLGCLDARTGRLLWEFEYPSDYEDLLGYNNGPRCSPVVDDGRVYLFGAEGILHCIDAEDGHLVWKVDTTERFGVVPNFFGVGSTPVVEGELVIVVVGGSPAESRHFGRFDLDRVVGNGTGIVAFDKRTGETRYAVTDELAGYASPKLATIDGRRWCFVFARGGLVGFNPANGEVDFHYPWRSRIRESVVAQTPVVVGNEVYISEVYGPGCSLLRVRPGGFDIVWRDPPGRHRSLAMHWNTPIHHEGYLYGSCGRYAANAEMRCIEWSTGKILWSEPGLLHSSLLYVDGRFISVSENGTLRMIRATEKRFDLLAEATLRETPDGPPLLTKPAWAAPILSNGLLYVRGNDRLVCLRLLAE